MKTAFLQYLRPVAPALLSIAFIQTATMALSPLMTLQLAMRDVSTEAIGIIASCYFVGWVAGSLTAARVVDRVGHIRALAVFVIIMVDSVILLALLPQPWLWAAIRVAMGYGTTGMFLVIESWFSFKSTQETRGRIFSSYMMVINFAGMLGPAALAFFDTTGTSLFLVIALFLATAVVPMALTQVGNPEVGQRTRFGLRRLYQISPLGVVVGVSGSLASTSFGALVPLYVSEIGLTATHLATLLVVTRIGSFVSQFPVGMLSDHFGRRPLMLAISAIVSVAALAVYFFGATSFPVLVGLCIILVGVASPLYALIIAHTNDHCRPEEYVAASGGLLLAWSIGSMIGPTIAGFVMGKIGASGLFLFMAVVYASILLFTIYRMLRRSAPRPDRVGTGAPVDVKH